MRVKPISNPDKFLIKRAGYWHYQRRVPGKFKHIDSRLLVRKTLDTSNVEIARIRRDALVEADDAFWRACVLEADANGGISTATLKAQQSLYNAATARALVYGYIYKTVDKLASEGDPWQVVDRIQSLKKNVKVGGLASKQDTFAVLGGVPEPEIPKVRISEVLEIFISKIAFDDQYNKSDGQKDKWEKRKRSSVKYFIERMGDLYIEDITRDLALAYRDWWMDKMIESSENPKPAKPNTVNRHIGNMRSIYQRYFEHVGQEDRPNPFRNFFFKGETRSSVLAFPDNWVRSKILEPGMFSELSLDLQVIIYTLIETGARMSEICNLMPEDIKLRVAVPHISIKPRQNRELKTSDSERDIPLVGVALVAMQACPEGFEHYRDKGELVSANLMKAFRNRNLLPTKNHVIYSFRHAFEKRMQEANIDYGLRCLLMGHKNDRPAYGDGGSMEYRRDELLKIAHPFSSQIFTN